MSVLTECTACGEAFHDLILIGDKQVSDAAFEFSNVVIRLQEVFGRARNARRDDAGLRLLDVHMGDLEEELSERATRLTFAMRGSLQGVKHFGSSGGRGRPS